MIINGSYLHLLYVNYIPKASNWLLMYLYSQPVCKSVLVTHCVPVLFTDRHMRKIQKIWHIPKIHNFRQANMNMTGILFAHKVYQID